MQYMVLAFLAALFFGASTPVGKLFLDQITPFQLAGLFYFGGALGVLPLSLKAKKSLQISNINKKNLVYLVGAIIFGGIGGPVLLFMGLRSASAASVSMWLNLELVATALLGYFIFRDHLGKHGWLGVAGTVIASVLLSWHEGSIGFVSLLLVGAGCLCWGLDNHLTALIDGITPTQSTFWKGIVAGSINLLIGLSLEPFSAAFTTVLLALLIGAFAYGLSISFYITAAQNLGATRSQMIFACAPFFGVAISACLLSEGISFSQVVSAVILAASLIVLFREQHAHNHQHEKKRHKHWHTHRDDHHDHESSEGGLLVYHEHWHEHPQMCHAHPHLPDIHHRHLHG